MGRLIVSSTHASTHTHTNTRQKDSLFTTHGAKELVLVGTALISSPFFLIHLLLPRHPSKLHPVMGATCPLSMHTPYKFNFHPVIPFFERSENLILHRSLTANGQPRKYFSFRKHNPQTFISATDSTEDYRVIFVLNFFPQSSMTLPSAFTVFVRRGVGEWEARRHAVKP